LLFCKSRIFAPAAIALSLLLPGCEASQGSTAAGPDRWWPSYGGTFANTRHAELAQIGPRTVGLLKLAWKFNTGVHGQLETSPIVVDGVMYLTTGPDNGVYALDAATGALKWKYAPTRGSVRYVFDVNRGVAVAAGRVFFMTLDARLIALDARNGTRIWDAVIGDTHQGLSETAAPLAAAGLVFVGSSGNEYGVRGSYSAYSQKDGKLVWRWWVTSPGWEGTFENTVRGFPLHRDIARERASRARFRDAWKQGGGAIWMTPALSEPDSAVYLSTGNPAPAFNGERRPGDNLYTESIVALDMHSGKLKWYYQETPHDVWDYDASSPPVLIDALDGAGRRLPAVAEAGKTGWLYILDRKTGRPLRVSEPFIPQPHVYEPFTAAGVRVQPGDMGGAIGPIAYDPARHAAFVAGNVAPEIAQTFKPPAWSADSEDQWEGGTMTEIEPAHGTSLLSCVDVDTGRILWSRPEPNLIYGGLLSTNGLVFMGQAGSGTFRAYDASNGKVLWDVNPGDTLLSNSGLRDRALHMISTIDVAARKLWRRVRQTADYSSEDIHAPPVAYRMGGREYIAIASDVHERGRRAGGNTVFAFTLP
jgi:alcohol dehydrogenase (cytochrome c)